MFNIILLIIGFIIASIFTMLYTNKMLILMGSDWVVTALMRMLLNGQTSLFFGALVITGIALPCIAIYTAPIFDYSEMINITVLLGLVLVIFGTKGLFKLGRNNASEHFQDVYIVNTAEQKKEITSLRTLINMSTFLMIVSFSIANIGLWKIAAMTVVTNSFVILYVIIVALRYTFKITLGAMGKITVVIGLIILITSIVLTRTQNGQISGAETAGLIVGLALSGLGGLAALGDI